MWKTFSRDLRLYKLINVENSWKIFQASCDSRHQQKIQTPITKETWEQRNQLLSKIPILASQYQRSAGVFNHLLKFRVQISARKNIDGQRVCHKRKTFLGGPNYKLHQAGSTNIVEKFVYLGKGGVRYGYCGANRVPEWNSKRILYTLLAQNGFGSHISTFCTL